MNPTEKTPCTINYWVYMPNNTTNELIKIMPYKEAYKWGQEQQKKQIQYERETYNGASAIYGSWPRTPNLEFDIDRSLSPFDAVKEYRRLRKLLEPENYSQWGCLTYINSNQWVIDRVVCAITIAGALISTLALYIL